MKAQWTHSSGPKSTWSGSRPWTARGPGEFATTPPVPEKRSMSARPSTPERNKGQIGIRLPRNGLDSAPIRSSLRTPSPPRSVSAASTITQLEGTKLPSLSDGDVVMRRFSFETGVLNPLPHTQHFDVFIGKENAIEHRTDYLRVYYTDFLSHNPKPFFQIPENNVVDAETLREWILTAIPRTRVDAYPLFVLLKDLLTKLMNKELEIMDSELSRLRREKVELMEEIERLKRDMGNQISLSDSRIQQLLDELADMKEKLGESTKLQKSLSEEGKDLKKQLHDSILKLKQSDAELQRSQAASKQLQQVKADNLKAQATISQLQAKLQAALDAGSKPSSGLGDLDIMSMENKRELLLKLLDERPTLIASIGVEKLVNRIPAPIDHAVLKALCLKLMPKDGKEMLSFFSEVVGEEPLAVLGRMVNEHVENGSDPEAIFAQVQKNEKNSQSMWKLARGIINPVMIESTGTALMDLLGDLLGGDQEVDDFLKRMNVQKPSPSSSVADVETQTEAVAQEEEETPVEEAIVDTPSQKAKRVRHMVRTGDKIWKKSQEKPMLVANMLKVIAQILEEKVIADEVDDRENNARQTMAEFTKDFFTRTYGLKSLALKNLASLGAGVRKYFDQNNRIRLFGIIAGVIPYEGDFYVEGSGDLLMDSLGQLFPKSSISERLAKDNPKVPLDAIHDATLAGVRMAKNGAGIGSTDRVMEKVVEKSADSATIDVDTWMQLLLEEWVRYNEAGEPDIIKLFYQMDDNASGILSEAEFVEGSLRLVEGTTEEMAVEMFSKHSVDRGGVKVLNEEAFAALLRANREFAEKADVEILDILPAT